jgi:tRNA (guanine-N7-)-methyltransferase
VPHLVTKSFKIFNTPQTIDGINYVYFAKNIKYDNEYLCKVNIEDKSFLLQIKEKPNKVLIKSEKYTRISPVIYIHKALNGFKQFIQTPIDFNNLNLKKNTHLEQNKALKNINYYIKDHSFKKEHWIEVGFGSGRHLLHQAQNNPNIEFIGLEIHKPSIEQVLKQIKIRNLKNLTLLDYDARLFLEFIPSNIVGKIFVHFPVPWDKKQNRRVIKSSFTKEALRTLKIDGTLEVRTDSENYFTHTTKIFLENNTLRMKINKNHNNDISSKYEDRWVKQEKNIYDIILYAEENSPNISINNNFSFEDIQIDKKRLQTLLNKKFLYDHSFIHIERIYEINQKHFLISLTLGSFEQPEHLFLELQNNTIVYYPHLPIPSKINQILHINLKEVLNG